VDLAVNTPLTPNWVTATPQGGVIDPGEAGTIDLLFSAPDNPGTLTATLWLVGDDPTNPDLRIPITLNVLNGLFLPVIGK